MNQTTSTEDVAAPVVGDLAPDFELKDTHGTPVRLSALRGTPVLVVFYPFAFSGICTGEALRASRQPVVSRDGWGASARDLLRRDVLAQGLV